MDKKFNGEMLTLARQTRKMSQADTIAALGGRITQGTLSKLEHGLIQPDESLARALAKALRIKPSFFDDPSYVRSLPVSYHRKRQKLSAKDEGAIHGQSEIFRLNVRKLLESIELEHRRKPVPHLDVDIHSGQIEKIAQSVREHWDLPRGPIKSVTKLMEDSGIVVIPFNFGTTLMDGFAQRSTDSLPAIVFINNAQSLDRYRFSLAHELGHLTMHLTPTPNQEIEANKFASAFLMPKSDIQSHLNNLSIQKLQELKMHWGVSMQALIYRSWELGMISDRSRKYYFIEMNKRGWREKEPVDVVASEKATALRDVMATYVDELGYSTSEISDLFGLEEEEVLQLFPIGRSTRPKLKLVIG